MILAKTARGRALLSERRALSPRERQLMVLADGRRSTAELERWLGFSVEPVMQRLVHEGYLERVRIGWADAPSHAPAGFSLPSGAPRAAVAAVVAHGVPPEPEREAPRDSSHSRRSLAASKMYVVSLMQMLRDVDAASLAVSLHCAEGAEELVDELVAALAFVHRRSGPDYAARVAARLMEVMPHVHLPQLCDALEATGATALKDAAAAQRESDVRRMPVRPEAALA